MVLNPTDSSIVTGTVTDNRGSFDIPRVPAGQYVLKYRLLGYEEKESPKFAVDDGQNGFDAGTIFLKESEVKLGEVTVNGMKPVFTNSVDRKVYNVQQDILSKTGSVSDLLQNVPSVQVDVDGTVSLRGSSAVQILINGKLSPLMASGASDILQQIPASSVERIEVITNPSAKFKPEGTSGIINIVLKQDANVGLNGTISVNGGNDSRYNVSVSGNYSTNGLNVFGTYSYRKDERSTYANDDRQQRDITSNVLSVFNQRGRAFARPYSQFLTFGADYSVSTDDKTGLSWNFRRRGYTSNDTTSYLLTDNNGVTSSDYDRLRTDYDQTPVSGGTAFYQHDFVRNDHTLRFEFTASHLFDEEDNRFTNIFRVPDGIVTYDNRRIREYNNKQEFTADYHNKINEGSVLEAGYDGTFSRVEFPFTGSYFDTTQHAFVDDTTLDNHFLYQEKVHAIYATYEQALGPLSILGGLRFESAQITSDLITTGESVTTNYLRMYPTLHITDKLNEFNELQLNYSLRVDRPRSDDLNPFPEYQNPRSLRAGNPSLKPEFIHSFEFGCEIQNNSLSIVPGLFYRNRYNGFTTVTTPLNDSTLLTTEQNLSSDQSGGFELVVAGKMLSILDMNLSGNTFYEQIDATNLGYTGKRSAFSWNATLNCNIHVLNGTMVQLNGNYHSPRLTPQGEVSPNYVINLGLRQDLLDERLSFVATVTDVFATLKRTTALNTIWLTENANFTRDSRVFFFGLTYNFGNKARKEKEKSLQYDDNG
jgi:outer membrane receptor protein involved in Fe transport